MEVLEKGRGQQEKALGILSEWRTLPKGLRPLGGSLELCGVLGSVSQTWVAKGLYMG